MRKRLAIISLILVFILVGIVSTGCGQTTEKQDNTTAQSTVANTDEAQATQKELTPLKMSYMSWDGTPINANTPVQGMIEAKLKEKLGFDVSFELIDVTFEAYEEKMNLLVSSGSTPDVFWVGQRMDKFIDQDAVAGIDMKTFEENCPNLVAYINGCDEKLWDNNKKGDKYYGLPYPWFQGMYPRGMGWRTDLLQKAGVAKIPETLDEMEAAFKAVKETLKIAGVSAYGKDGDRNFNSIFGAFGILPNMWNLKDGKVVWGAVQPECREALTVLNKWYKEGYVLKDWAITDQTSAYNALFNGTVVLNDDIPWIRLYDGPDADPANFPPQARAINPDAKIEFGTAPKGPDGKFGQLAFGYAINSHYFGAQLEQDSEKLSKVLKVLDALGTDEEMFLLAQFGTEGTDWKKDDKGVITRLGDSVAPEGQAKIGNTGYFRLMALDNGDLYKKNMFSAEFNVYLDKFLSGVNRWMPAINVSLGEPEKMYKADLDKLVFVNYVKFINGQKSIDDFDKFVKEWYDKGGTELEKAANDAYQQYQGK